MDAENIFNQLFDKWTDTKQVREFFDLKVDQLFHSIWDGMTKEEAIDKVLDEAYDFEEQLKCIETREPECEDVSLDDVFEDLHKEGYALKPKNKPHKKGKPNFRNPVLRIYGLRLDDGCYIITGGGIKLTKTMKEADLQDEVTKIEKLQRFLLEEGISDKQGLLELIN